VLFIECHYNLIMILIIDKLSLEIQYAFGDDVPINVIIIVLMGMLLCVYMIQIADVIARKVRAAIQDEGLRG
jgi:hypothetical protein